MDILSRDPNISYIKLYGSHLKVDIRSLVLISINVGIIYLISITFKSIDRQ
jgi:hypothetical protein